MQRQTFRFFWEGAHPVSGLAPDRRTERELPMKDTVAVGGSGFGVMAIIVAVERGWITRDAAIERLKRMLDVLVAARCYHGALPHFMNGVTGETVPFTRRDDAADIVETALLIQGLICARQYFTQNTPDEDYIRTRILWLWEEVEWNWFTQGRDVLYWHWSPYNGWVMNHEVRGWNECLIAYVLAAGSPRYAIDPGGVSPRLSHPARLPQRQQLLRHRIAARHAVRRAAVLHALLVLRPRSARAGGSLRRLLGAESPARADQPCALCRKPSWPQGVW